MTLCRVVAQQTIDDVYQYKIDEERLIGESISSDTLLFYRAVHSHRDMYGQITDYRFSFVDYSRRGVEFFRFFVVLDGLESMQPYAGRSLLKSIIALIDMPILLQAGYLHYGDYVLETDESNPNIERLAEMYERLIKSMKETGKY